MTDTAYHMHNDEPFDWNGLALLTLLIIACWLPLIGSWQAVRWLAGWL